MTKRFCDRCDEERKELVQVKVPAAFMGESEKNVELCSRCVAYLRQAVEPLPKYAEATG
jgi:hypothetical protein